MTDRIDHAARALRLSQSEYSDPRTATAVAIQTEALVHATLALVEAQQEANDIARAQALIALSQAEDQNGTQSEAAMQAVWRHGPARPEWQERYDREPRPTPEIAAALGINDDKESNE